MSARLRTLKRLFQHWGMHGTPMSSSVLCTVVKDWRVLMSPRAKGCTDQVRLRYLDTHDSTNPHPRVVVPRSDPPSRSRDPTDISLVSGFELLRAFHAPPLFVLSFLLVHFAFVTSVRDVSAFRSAHACMMAGLRMPKFISP